MTNVDYELQRKEYLNSLVFRVMELESTNELLKEKLNQSSTKSNVHANAILTDSPACYAQLQEKLNEANQKYKQVTKQYSELKEKFNNQNQGINLPRKIALFYGRYGFKALIKRIFHK